MKKIISFLLIYIIIFINIFTLKVNASNCFIVTAYYSPLQNQRYFFKGNYEDEIKLNGRGITGASGKPVFSGMFAAPKKYPFGTKIYIDGVGVGEVADRGGDIVSTDPSESRGYEYDRIDIWMGHGEEGLARALTWGKRTVCNSYVLEDNNSPITLDIKKFPAPESVLKKLTKNNGSVYDKDIGVKSSIEDVKMLHEFLASIGLYKGEINTTYNKETIKRVYKFQLQNNIVNSPKNNGAGLWGEETRLVAKRLNEESKKELVKNNAETIKNNQEDDVLAIFDKYVGPESKAEDIKKIQSIFKEMGIYNNEINGKYDDIKEVLIDYQLKTGVIKDRTNEGAGYFGPKTRAKAKKDYLLFLENEKAKKDLEKKLQEEQKKIEMELAKIRQEIEKKVSIHIENIGNPKEGDIGENVRLLQKTLKTLGYLKIKDSDIFGINTKNSLIKFQIDKKIISSKDDFGAGYFGPKTKEALKKELISVLEKHVLKEKKLLSYKK